MFSQTCVSFFLLFNTKDGILKNVSEQMVVGPTHSMEKNIYYGSQRVQILFVEGEDLIIKYEEKPAPLKHYLSSLNFCMACQDHG